MDENSIRLGDPWPHPEALEGLDPETRAKLEEARLHLAYMSELGSIRSALYRLIGHARALGKAEAIDDYRQFLGTVTTALEHERDRSPHGELVAVAIASLATPPKRGRLTQLRQKLAAWRSNDSDADE